MAYWHSTKGYVNQLDESDWCFDGVVVAWALGGQLLDVTVQGHAKHDLRIEHDTTSESVRVGPRSRYFRHGLWIEVPAQGHISIVEYVEGQPKGFHATRGLARFDFIGRHLESGEYEPHESVSGHANVGGAVIAAMSDLVGGTSGADFPEVSDAGLPLYQRQHDHCWGIEWVGSSFVGARIAGARHLVEVPFTGLRDGVIRVVDVAEGGATILRPHGLAGHGLE